MAKTTVPIELSSTPGIVDNSNATAITIDSSENVGIGTSPSTKLHISSTGNTYARIDGGATSTTGVVFDGGDGAVYYDANSNFMRLDTNGSERMRIDSSGSVGIGTTSPSTKVAVGTSALETIGYGIDWTGAGSGQVAGFTANTSTGEVRIGATNAAGTYFPTFYSNGAEAMRIDSSGKVGIGTTNPLSDLHLSNGGAEGIELYAGSGGNINATQHYNRSSSVYVTHRVIAADHRFEIGGTEAMRIDSSGGVLVGTTNISSGTGVQLKNEAFIVNVANGFTLFKNVRGDTAGQSLICDRDTDGGQLIDFRHGGNSEGNISVSGATVSYNGFSGTHESSGIPTDTEVGTVVSTIDELDTYTTGSKAEQTRADHAKIKVSDVEGDARVYGVLSKFDENDKPVVASVGIGSVKVTGACNGGDLLESNGDGTAKVQSDDIIRSKTIGKVTIGNSDAGVKFVSCVLYCG